jgi:hypothetical protein
LQKRHFATGTPIALLFGVNIRFVSTLTPEDENLMAPAVLKAISAILDILPIAYMIRIDTSDAQAYYHHSQPGGGAPTLLPSPNGQASQVVPLTSFDS